MIDAELVRRKLTLIAKDLDAIEALGAKPLDEYLASEIHEVAAERYLERAVGRMIDVNYHVLTELGHAPPRDFYESFVELGTAGVLPADFARALAPAAGLRNRIAHEYDAIDPTKVHAALSAAGPDARRYIKHVHEFLAAQGL